jgi:pimeloyl-ACP methyl ester carboxylesterase
MPRLALELRAPLEFAASFAAAPWLATAPRGDGHPVMVFPGFLATDFSTGPMRRLLRWLGHDVHGWGQGRNLRPSPEVIDKATARIIALRAQHGRRVSLVGWSLGGLYARELAKRAPGAVRCVVSLGSPFSGPLDTTRASGLFERINRGKEVALTPEDLEAPPPVPTTSIYSTGDAIVAWQVSQQAAGPLSESVRVPASHFGLGVNPWALYALADRLAQPEGQWQAFKREGKRRAWYPKAAQQAAAPR